MPWKRRDWRISVLKRVPQLEYPQSWGVREDLPNVANGALQNEGLEAHNVVLEGAEMERRIPGPGDSGGLPASGNAAKAGVRFLSYDHFKHKLADSQVRLSYFGLLFPIRIY